MSQPPDQPAPEDRPWPDPGPPRPGPPDPYGSAPPPYGGGYGHPAPHGGGDRPPPYGQGGLPQYGGGAYGGPPGPAARLAGRWARLGAAIIDLILLGVAGSLISLPFVSWHRLTHPRHGELVSPEQYKLNLVGLIIGFLYFWLLTYRWNGRTVGKRILGIRVVRADDGGPIGNTQALMRALVYAVLGNLCSCFGLVNVAWILWDRRRQALHDKAARTVVVKDRPGAPAPYATTTS
ncbi:RDD family protein [Actinomadura scrupuli]|uniref:RDD family protein n=1 Tax=Actinomadura scrupuli TaxID=559629 RepID=UPI003D995F1A